LVVGTTLRKASNAATALHETRWTFLESAANLAAPHRVAGQSLAQRWREALIRDEHLVGLAAALHQIEDDAARLLADVAKPTVAATARTPAPAPMQVAQRCNDRYTAKHHAPATPPEEPDLAAGLKRLYGRSQIVGDSVPAGLPSERVIEVLEVQVIRPLAPGAQLQRSDMIVVSPTLQALMAMDPDCQVDLASKRMRLFGVELQLEVNPHHHDQAAAVKYGSDGTEHCLTVCLPRD
jgi:hypothetical protein